MSAVRYMHVHTSKKQHKRSEQSLVLGMGVTIQIVHDDTHQNGLAAAFSSSSFSFVFSKMEYAVQRALASLLCFCVFIGRFGVGEDGEGIGWERGFVNV